MTNPIPAAPYGWTQAPSFCPPIGHPDHGPRPTTYESTSYVRRYFAHHLSPLTPPAIIYAAIDSPDFPDAKDVLFILPADPHSGAAEYRGRFTVWIEASDDGRAHRLYGEW